jgi:ribose transport system substrate-binding protein
MRWKLLLLVGVLLAAAAIVGLLGRKPDAVVAGKSAPAASSVRHPRVALVMKTLTSPFFVAMERGARRAEAEFGVELLVRTAAQETSIEQQITIIDQLTRAKVDAIVVAPGDSFRLTPALKKAKDAGIIVINVDNKLDADFSHKLGFADVPFISVDNDKGAYLSAKEITRGVVEPTAAAIIEGIRSAANAEARKLGALRAFAENPMITVVASESANWKIDDAYDVARKLFAEHSQIKLLFCANDFMALGALRFLADAGIPSVKVAGYDALEEAKQAIRDGSLAVSIDQQVDQQGFLGVAYAARALKGEALPAETMLDVAVVTAETLDRPKK